MVGTGVHAGIRQIQEKRSIVEAAAAARCSMKEILIKLKGMMDQDEFEEILTQAKRDRIKVTAMLRAYKAVYPTRLPMIKMEGRFKIAPIVNPATGRESRTFNWSGIYDGLYRLDDGRYMLYELKSTSDSVKEAAQVFAQALQPQLYLAMIPEDVPMAGICIDIVKKPVAPFKRPARKTPVHIDEPLKDYEERCYRAYIKKPERFFRRMKLPHEPWRIREAKSIAWRIAQEIRDSDRHGYLACRGRNCKTTYGWCDYRNICWYFDFNNFYHSEFAHEELELTE
jgi:hypothetical protein